MRLTDILDVAQWEALERELSEVHKVSVNVYDPDGFMVTDYVFWANKVCPVVKQHHQSTQAVCSIASQNAIAESKRTGGSCIIACDAGFCKITSPIVVDGEFLGVLGACGPLLEEEVETFYVGMLTGREESEIAALCEGLEPIGGEEARRLAGLLEERINMLTNWHADGLQIGVEPGQGKRIVPHEHHSAQGAKAMGKNKLEIEGVMERSQVVAYLENLVAGLKAGSIHVQAGQESAVLSPPSIIDFEMEVAQKKEKNKIALEISWKIDEKSAAQSIRISSDKPEA